MGIFSVSRMGFRTFGVLGLAVVTLAACSGNDKPLPGQRLSIRPADTTIVVNRSAAITLPRAVNNAEWAAENGSIDHSGGNFALASAPTERWAVEIGRGIGRDYRLTSGPVAADGRIFAMDSAGHITAITPNGDVIWNVDVTPPNEHASDGSGGGLSLAKGVLYAGTGFGEVIALDPVSGGVKWRRQVSAPIYAAPVSDGRNVYFVSRDDVGYAISARDGALLWITRGAISVGGYDGGASPAVRSGQVVLPFSSGNLVTVRANNGKSGWTGSVDGATPSSALSRIGDITGAPVIDGNKVYAANISGQTVRVNLQTGKRAWALGTGALGPVWPAGNAVFLVSSDARLMRVNASNGQVIWAQQMPRYTNPAKRKGVIDYYGPVLGGGLFWVADSNGGLRGYAPEGGALVTSLSVKNGAAAAPIFMGGVMYVLARDGKLHAFQ